MKIIATTASLLFGSLLLCFFGSETRQKASALTGGNPDAGRSEIEYYGCASCHEVPGVAGANGLIGPSLKHVANRNYIGGVLKNSPDNLIHWIQNAPAVDPKTAMPNLQIPESQARDVASYLYTLE
jgi:cytochrome c